MYNYYIDSIESCRTFIDQAQRLLTHDDSIHFVFSATDSFLSSPIRHEIETLLQSVGLLPSTLFTIRIRDEEDNIIKEIHDVLSISVDCIREIMFVTWKDKRGQDSPVRVEGYVCAGLAYPIYEYNSHVAELFFVQGEAE
jgi:hypothetical protein